MSMVFDESNGPGRCAAFLIDNDTGAPAVSALAYAYAELSVRQNSAQEAADTSDGTPLVRIPLGMLGSDHSGYLSWDLEPLRRTAVRLAENTDGSTATVRLEHIWLLLNGPLQSSVDVLAEADPEADALVIRLGVDARGVYSGQTGVPAMQSPSLLDWYLSPGSFANVPAELVGADGCEALLPSNVATQKYQAQQVVLLPDVTATWNTSQSRGVAMDDNGTTVPVAMLISYDVTWIPVGHGLGQIAYSLPLAPGEEVQLAVVDWSRTSVDTRDESIALTDSLDHNQIRDRTVDEVVKASLSEWQRGGSIMGGAAASGTMGFVGGAASLGGGYATTSGDRNVSASTVQNLTDQVHQHSTAVRDMRSTVVIQSRQSENSTAQTRVVRNHNHAHAMTLLYYEVLRHYRVVIERGPVRPAVLLPWNPPNLDDEKVVVRYRRFLEPALLVPGLAGAFDAVEKYAAWQELQPEVPQPVNPGSVTFMLFRMRFLVGGQSSSDERTRTQAVVTQIAPDGPSTTSLVRPAPSAWEPDPKNLENPSDFQNEHVWVEIPGVPEAGTTVVWSQLRTITVTLSPPVTPKGLNADVPIDHVTVEGIDTNGATHLLVDQGGHFFPGANTTSWDLPVIQPPPGAPVPTPFQRLSDDENLLRVRLRHHLVENKEYYWRLIRLGEDPNSRIVEFSQDQLTFGGTTQPLLQAIENRAMEIWGTATAFPVDPALFSGDDGGVHLPEVAAARSEDLVSLPSRGIFAEAKLGHCNAAEIIDNTRFWDWQKSPDPDKAPDIAAVSTATREVVTSTTPSGLPASMVNIVQPPAAPDPVGMAAALQLLGQGNAFRDMSMQTEVASLLQTLSNNATLLAGKTLGGGQTGAGGGQTGGGTGGTGGGTGGTGGGTGGTGGGTGGTGGGTGGTGGGTGGTGGGTGGTGGGTGGTGGGTGGTGGGTGGTGDTGSGTGGTGGGTGGTGGTGGGTGGSTPPPTGSPRPPHPITPKVRSFTFEFATLNYGGTAQFETGQFAIDISQEVVGKGTVIVDHKDGIQPGARGVLLVGAVDLNYPVSIVVSGVSQHMIINVDDLDHLFGPTVTYNTNKNLLINKLNANQQNYAFVVRRNTSTAGIELTKTEVSGHTVESAVAGKLDVGIDKLVSLSGELDQKHADTLQHSTTEGAKISGNVTYYTGDTEIVPVGSVGDIAH